MSNTWAAPRETLNAYNTFDYPESLNMIIVIGILERGVGLQQDVLLLVQGL